MEGWEAWDVALKCAGQLRTAQIAIVGIDLNAALRVAEALSYDKTAAAELLAASESGIIWAINKQLRINNT